MSGPNAPQPGPQALRFSAAFVRANREVDGWRLLNGYDGGGVALERLGKIKSAAKDQLATLDTEVKAATGAEHESAAESATEAVWRFIGHYRSLVVLLDQLPFTVSAKADAQGHLEDIVIETRDGRIPPDSNKLKTEIDAAANVVRTVLAERLRLWHPLFSRATRAELLALRSEYLEELVGIGKVGLETNEPTRMAFARADLVRMTGLFTLREAGLVKNAYVNRLATWSGMAALVFFGLYCFARGKVACEWLPFHDACVSSYELRNFHLLAAGTAIGTWLSFSLRRQELTFADLAVLEPDRLDPAIRVVFMIGLSSLVGLLLFSGAVVAGVGPAQGFDGMHAHGTTALMIGMLAGVAERALGNAVSRRGQEFATVIGGSAARASTLRP